MEKSVDWAGFSLFEDSEEKRENLKPQQSVLTKAATQMQMFASILERHTRRGGLDSNAIKSIN